MPKFDRRIISIHDEENLSESELILKQTVNTTVKKLPLATFRQHEKQNSEGDEGTDQLTNQSVGGVQRARNLAQHNPNDTLPAVYGGLFTVAEYFTRSFDAIKGKFFEKVIAAEDPSERLDVDRNLVNLVQYLLEPNACWKTLDYTRETPTENEQDHLNELESISLDLDQDHQQANADAILFHEMINTLAFGEHRTSVVSGGTTARPSLMRKPRALVREMTKYEEIVTISATVARRYDLTPGQYNLPSLLNEIGVDAIHFHIGILFDEHRRPAVWNQDPQRSTSHRLIREFAGDFLQQETNEIRNVNLEDSNLKLEFDIPIQRGSDQTIRFHLSFLYGDIYLNTLYTGSLDAVGENGSLTAFDDPHHLRGIISENEADDLWLGFSVAERENKVYEISTKNTNNAIEIANMILNDSELTERLIAFRSLTQTGEREEIDAEFLSFATDIAEIYDERRNNKYVSYIYDGNPVDYLRDVGIQVLVYDTISRPLFLLQFPEVTSQDDDDESNPLEDARETFENYLFDIGSNTTKKQDIYRCIRYETRYHRSGTNVPDGPDDRIDWAVCPTPTEIGELLDIRTPSRIMDSMVEGTADNNGGILTRQGDKYAVPASVASVMGRFMLELPPDQSCN